MVFGGFFSKLATDPNYGYVTEISPAFRDIYMNSTDLEGDLGIQGDIAFDMEEDFGNVTAKDYDDYFDITPALFRAVDYAKESFGMVMKMTSSLANYLHLPKFMVDILLTILALTVLFATLYAIFKVRL